MNTEVNNFYDTLIRLYDAAYLARCNTQYALLRANAGHCKRLQVSWSSCFR